MEPPSIGNLSIRGPELSAACTCAPAAAPHQLLRLQHRLLVKDFIETHDGLLAAVVSHGLEHGRALVAPRYLRLPGGRIAKLDAATVQRLMAEDYAHYSHYSSTHDVRLIGVPEPAIAVHYQPCKHFADLLRDEQPSGVIGLRDLFARLAAIIDDQLPAVGITGSHLLAAAGPHSDIDLVVYGLKNFNLVRDRFVAAMQAGQLEQMSPAAWAAAYRKRACSSLSLEEYVWHERRKQNKFFVDGIKVDLSCVDLPAPAATLPGKKCGSASIRARVTDDSQAFNTPAVLRIEHPQYRSIVINTATYVGQAKTGEWIEAVGVAERDIQENFRLVVGASREAPGELIRVLRKL